MVRSHVFLLPKLLLVRPPGSQTHQARLQHCREEHSMDQYRSRLKLSENFERHWSIRISGEIHMDQSLVHTFCWGNSYGPMVLKVLLNFFSTGICPWMALPSTGEGSKKQRCKKLGAPFSQSFCHCKSLFIKEACLSLAIG